LPKVITTGAAPVRCTWKVDFRARRNTTSSAAGPPIMLAARGTSTQLAEVWVEP
jgi:hypothetical protein